jgi:phosphatidate phosphatase APP1
MIKPLSLLLLFFLLPGQVPASEIKADEEVLLFPSYAWLQDNGKVKISFHVWVYEPGENGVKKRALRKGVEKILKSDINRTGEATFNRRVKHFLADNERNKKITISLPGRDIPLGKTGPDGHIYAEPVIGDRRIIEKLVRNKRVPCRIKLRKNETREYTGYIFFIPEKGVTVISDIDDTIKISNVLDKKELIRNTFLKDFQPVTGASTLYNRWKKRGALFHYVSGSPWQLYLPISRFLDKYSFPRGAFSLKPFRLRPSRIYEFISAEQLVYKKEVIEGIINKFPGRKFILVGDSGEKDPEVYSAIARKFPKKILFILIRNAGNTKPGYQRMEKLFPKDFPVRWKMFKHVSELKERYLHSF